MSKPILYLQHYFKQHRQEYYERLQAVRARGEWREWLTILGARYNRPLLAVKDVIELTGTSYPSTSDLVAKFVKFGVLTEITGLDRNRRFRYAPYIPILSEST